MGRGCPWPSQQPCVSLGTHPSPTSPLPLLWKEQTLPPRPQTAPWASRLPGERCRCRTNCQGALTLPRLAPEPGDSSGLTEETAGVWVAAGVWKLHLGRRAGLCHRGVSPGFLFPVSPRFLLDRTSGPTSSLTGENAIPNPARPCFPGYGCRCLGGLRYSPRSTAVGASFSLTPWGGPCCRKGKVRFVLTAREPCLGPS